MTEFLMKSTQITQSYEYGFEVQWTVQCTLSVAKNPNVTNRTFLWYYHYAFSNIQGEKHEETVDIYDCWSYICLRKYWRLKYG